MFLIFETLLIYIAFISGVLPCYKQEKFLLIFLDVLYI